MLDSFLVPDDDEPTRSGQELFLASFVFTAMAIWITHTVMPLELGGTNLNGLMAVLFTTIALLYPLTRYIRSRDKTEIDTSWPETRLIDRHLHEGMYYIAAFTGVTLGFAAAIHLLPEQFFAIQRMLVQNIQAMAGQIAAPAKFSILLINNIGVMVGTFVLSFFITGGLVFILVLNASNLGYVIGTTAQSIFEIPLQTLPYVAHGTFEIGGYIAAGLAGMLLSYSVEQVIHHDNDFTLTTPVKDAGVLLIVGMCLLIIAAAIESGSGPVTGLIETARVLG